MGIRELASTHLPMAVVASIGITIFNIYTGEITTLTPLVSDFLLHTFVIFVGFVIFDAVWYRLFDESGV